MDFGYYLVTQYDESRDLRTVGDELVEQTKLAERVGFDGIHTGEHHATEEDQYLLNETVLAHVAEHVNDMFLSTSLCLLPFHNPVRIAELGASLDILTGGSFRLGVGLGYREKEYEVFGVSKEESPGRLAEGVEIIKLLWTRDTVSFNGDHFELESVGINPQPLQDPRPIIWIGASNESSIRRGARIADGFLGAHVPIDIASRQIRDFRDEREAQNKDGGITGLLRETFVAETQAAAEDAVRDHLMNKYSSYIDWGQDQVIQNDSFESPWEKMHQERFLVGTPETVAADIRRYQELMDLDHLAVRMQFPNMDFEDVRNSIRLFGEEVAPKLR
jgi:alkanesulfonate monooxygenase SsuD/methylene tetrahydromethanopterin reductase-like flavin-dependent oxidoreductase (luciferase family)